MSDTVTCPAFVGYGPSKAGLPRKPIFCGKPIKRRDLCGIHARKLETREGWAAETAARDAANAAAKVLAQQFKARFGVTLSTRFSDGDLILTQRDAETILAALPPLPPSEGDGPFLTPLGAI